MRELCLSELCVSVVSKIGVEMWRGGRLTISVVASFVSQCLLVQP
jgi:hypothetical protein